MRKRNLVLIYGLAACMTVNSAVPAMAESAWGMVGEAAATGSDSMQTGENDREAESGDSGNTETAAPDADNTKEEGTEEEKDGTSGEEDDETSGEEKGDVSGEEEDGTSGEEKGDVSGEEDGTSGEEKGDVSGEEEGTSEEEKGETSEDEKDGASGEEESDAPEDEKSDMSGEGDNAASDEENGNVSEGEKGDLEKEENDDTAEGEENNEEAAEAEVPESAKPDPEPLPELTKEPEMTELAAALAAEASQQTEAEINKGDSWVADSNITVERVPELDGEGNPTGDSKLTLGNYHVPEDYTGYVNVKEIETAEDGSQREITRVVYIKNGQIVTERDETGSGDGIGWREDADGWRFIEGDGVVVTDQYREIGGKGYYLNESGLMVTDQVVRVGYPTEENGYAWVAGYADATGQIHESYKLYEQEDGRWYCTTLEGICMWTQTEC